MSDATNLVEYVIAHTERGECNCGHCLDRGSAPDPSGHVVDVNYFKVGACNSPTADALKAFVAAHKGEYKEMNPYDGAPHSFVDLGAWLGDQGLALQFMALSALLGIAQVINLPHGPVLVPNEIAELLRDTE